MGFSIDDGMVEGNLFIRRADGAQGKWKYTVQINMGDYWDSERRDCITPIHSVVNAVCDGRAMGVTQGVWAALRRERDAGRALGPTDESQLPDDGYWLVVQRPYHKNAYPVMVAV